MNKVVLKGNLARDPEVRYIPSGTAVVDFAVAVSRSYKKSDGEFAEKVAYVTCVSWNGMAERIGKMSKGDPIFVEGEIEEDRWETDGQKRVRLKVRVSEFERLWRKPKSSKQEPEQQSDEPAPTDEDGNDVPF